jgi:hypothetical protein
MVARRLERQGLRVTKPVSLVDKVRLRLYGPDTTTDRGVLSADGSTGLHSKDIESCTLTFTANALETVLQADPSLLDDAFAQPERYIGGSWVQFGTPYMLSPGAGVVYGPNEGAAQEQSPSGVGALVGLAAECPVMPKDPFPTSVTFRYAGGIEQNRYVGWMSIGYDETGDDWHDVDVYDPTDHPKENKPKGWPDDSAKWVYRDPSHGDTGGLSLFRFGTFTIDTDKRVHFLSVSDENHKLYLDGPNMGGCIIDFTSDEDGYNDEPGYWSRRLKAGTYRVSAEMRTVDSEGGDGNDSIRFTCYTFDLGGGSGDRETPTVLLRSKASTRVRRQSSTADRPGMTIGKTVRYLLEDAEQVMDDTTNAATILLANATFTDDDDSLGDPWPDGREWVFPIGQDGYSLASAFADMQEDADFDMGPGFTFDIYADRGTDLSSSLAFKPGAATPAGDMNIEGETYESDPAGPNGYMTQSTQGFDLRLGTVPAGSRRRLGALSLGTAGSVARARRLADAAIRQNRHPRRYYDYQIMQVTDAVFYTDVSLCDRVSGRDFTGTAEVQELTAFGWAVRGELATFTAQTTGVA